VYLDDFSVAPAGGGGGGALVLDTTVAALTYGVTGLAPETLYYARVRMAGGTWSEVVSATTTAGVDVPPVLNPIGNKSVTVSNALSFQVTATPTDGDPVTLTASNMPSGAFFYPTNAAGTFVWSSASTVGSYDVTFNAADENGSDAETITITVNPASTDLLAPVIQAASSVNTNRFNANWSASANATGYRLDVATNESFSTGGGGGEALLDEDFATLTDTTVPDGWSTSGSSDLDYVGVGYYGEAPPAYKFKATGQWLESPTFSSGATGLQFWALGNAGAGSTFTISGLVNSAWALVDTVVIASGGATYNVALDSQTTKFKISFTKVVNCGLDDVLVQGSAGGGESSFVSGYQNRDVGNVTTYAVTGLTENVWYYYRAKAYNVSSNSAYSSITNVLTAFTAAAPDLGSGSTFEAASGNMILFWDNSGGGTYRVMFATNLLTDPAFTRIIATNVSVNAYTSPIETEAVGAYRVEKE
jgi:hypothetical protein